VKSKKHAAGGLRLFLGLLSSVIAAALLLALAAFGLFLWVNAPPKTQAGFSPENPVRERGVRFEYGDIPEAKSVLVEVNDGESSYAVGRRLERAGLIKSRFFWNVLARLDGAFVKTGTYRIDLPATQMAIRAALIDGRQLLFSVTIPEGVTLKKISLILENAGICGAGDFLAAASDSALLDEYRVPGKTMEGYLYPETYFFPGAFPAEKVVRTMADTFFKKIREIAPESKNLNPRELNDLVILASIVERECQVNDEAALMADVFLKRLEIGMPLESNATVEYVITEIQGKPHPVRQFNSDTEIRDPYNTYVIPGLPPGPIAAPGRNSLEAVFYPADTEYFFFRVIDPDTGRHYFSRTFEEHLRVGRNYRPPSVP
jgi:UPF0755 protein